MQLNLARKSMANSQLTEHTWCDALRCAVLHTLCDALRFAALHTLA